MEGKISLHKFLVLISLLFIYWACEPTEDGCFDLLSANYGFEAVGECDSCCVYPNFDISFKVINDSIQDVLNDTIDLGGGDSIIFRKVEILFSEIAISGLKDTYTIRDSIFVNNNVVTDDYAYFQDAESMTIGQTRIQDTLQSISMFLGFNEIALSSYTPFANINSTSNLDLALDSLFNVNQSTFYFSRINVEIKDSLRELNLVNINDRVSFDLDQFVDAGVDWSINIDLDVNILKQGIDIGMTNEMLEETFRQNFISSLSVK